MLLLTFWGWVKLSSWMDYDAQKFNLGADVWNSILLAAGVVGLILLWLLASFWFGWFLFWLLVLGATGYYVYQRNEQVDDAYKVLTKPHLLDLARRYIPGFGKAQASLGDEKRIPIRFISRSAQRTDADEARLSRVQESKGYKAAIEIVWEAIQKRATDIHMEPSAEEMSVRLRIDGMMTNATPFSRMMGDAVVNIFKVICNLDITEKRKPQDGSFSAQVGHQDEPGSWTYRIVDFRVATAGSVSGEKMVMRILDASQQLVDLTHLGMPEEMRDQIRDIVTQPHGLFLVCGPTGSGKSTTLYACLHEIDRFSSNVITVENPVEYRLDNVTQIEINPKAGKTFASELRSILRQDPDVIMVGEIRDKETAEIACQAAQTGHMVFSTLHANDTVTAIGRLIDLGVAPFMIGSALSGVLGQRLVRRLCKACRQKFKPSADTLKRLGVGPDLVRYLYRPPEPKPGEEPDEEGQCEQCGGLGYYKRTGVFELLIVSDEMKEMIRANPNLSEIKAAAKRNGLHTLFEDGVRLVVEGETSLPELLRVAK
jgi:type II secretory ATPase GspE/PulE/Tfp pilus assembly ATPase PilB-like protein